MLLWSAKNDCCKFYLLPTLTFTPSPTVLLAALTPVDSIRSFKAQQFIEEELKNASFFVRGCKWHLSITGKKLAVAT